MLSCTARTNAIQFSMSMKNGDAHWSHKGTWEGLLPQSERLYSQTKSDYRRKELEKFMQVQPCPKCEGKRLKEKVLAVKLGDKSIVDATDLSIIDCHPVFRKPGTLGKGEGDRKAGLKGNPFQAWFP